MRSKNWICIVSTLANRSLNKDSCGLLWKGMEGKRIWEVLPCFTESSKHLSERLHHI